MNGKEAELKRLINEQFADDKSRRVSTHGREKVFDPNVLVGVSDGIQKRHEHNGSICWGMPAQILQLKMDKRCPLCDRWQGQEYVWHDKRGNPHIQLGNLDLENEGQETIACRCDTAIEIRPGAAESDFLDTGVRSHFAF